MISARQEKILYCLIKEYLDSAEPIASGFLKKRSGLNVSPATIRNELRELSERGYLEQPHISAGRVPTEKGYKYFSERIILEKESMFPDFIIKEIEFARQQIEKEMILVKELTESLEKTFLLLNSDKLDSPGNGFGGILKIVEISKESSNENIDLIKKLINELSV